MKNTAVRHGLAFAALLFLPGYAFANATATPKAPVVHLAMDLTPTRAPDGAANGVAVKYVATGLDAGTGLHLALDAMPTPLVRTTDVVTDLQVSDKHGTVPMNGPVNRHEGAHDYQIWEPTRRRPAQSR